MTQYKDQFINICLMAVFVFSCSIPLLIVLGLLSQFLPQQLAADAPHYFLRHRVSISPEHELSIYRLIIMVNLLGTIVGGWLLTRYNDRQDLKQLLLKLTVIQAIWVALELFIVFKTGTYEAPTWSHFFVWLTLGGNALFWIFFPEMPHVLAWQRTYLSPQRILLATIILLSMFLIIPDPAKIPLLSGIDNPLSILASWLSSGCRQAWHIDLRQGILMMSGMAVIYILTVTMLLWACFKDALLVAFALIFFVKIHFFNEGVLPIIWLNPSASFLPTLADALLFYMLLQHAADGYARYLWMAVLLMGVSLLWDINGGIKLYAVVMLYLGFTAWGRLFRGEHNAGERLGIMAALVTALVLVISWLSGQNPIEALWLKSWGVNASPYYECLKTRHFFAYIASFFIPIIYVATILFKIEEYAHKKETTFFLWPVLMSVYGLLIFGDYVVTSNLNGYYQGAFPLVAVICFWISRLLGRLSLKVKEQILWLIVAIAFLSLITNRLFGIYPHAFNLFL